MKASLLALLVGCAARVAPAPADDCVPPADWYAPNCIDPGGGVRRCTFPGGIQWDLRDGVATKSDASHPDPASSSLPVLCEVTL